MTRQVERRPSAVRVAACMEQPWAWEPAYDDFERAQLPDRAAGCAPCLVRAAVVVVAVVVAAVAAGG